MSADNLKASREGSASKSELVDTTATSHGVNQAARRDADRDNGNDSAKMQSLTVKESATSIVDEQRRVHDDAAVSSNLSDVNDAEAAILRTEPGVHDEKGQSQNVRELDVEARKPGPDEESDEKHGQHQHEISDDQAARKLPASPPPPALPQKDVSDGITGSAQVAEDVSTAVPDTSQFEGIPQSLQGSTEATGLEIQTIMEQFQSESPDTSEVSIMSPRLERQLSALSLPPRTSSLENRDSMAASGGLSDPQHVNSSPELEGHSSSIDTSRGRMGDDTESISSMKAGSIFQPPPPDPDPEPTLPFDFHRFLEQLRHRTADPVARFLRSFLTEFGKKQWMVHEQVKIISDFLEFIGKKMSQCEVWRSVTDAEFDNAKEGMEKLVMNRLYTQTFSPALPPANGSPRKGGRSLRSQVDAASPIGPGRRGQHQEDVERDDVIAQKLRIYGWVREEHLDINIIGDKGRKFLSLAQQELLKINTYRAPRDKVICVLNCCKVIFGFLKNAKADQSADAFLPLLIYTVLQAKPEHLVSNVQYIWRFRNQGKLGGETGYYMSSLMGVITFIESLDRTTLTITDEEFERNVEQAVSAIAQDNRSEEYEQKTHAVLSSSPVRQGTAVGDTSSSELTPLRSTKLDQSSPTRRPNLRSTSTVDDQTDATDPVGGLLRTIQRPLHTIGRIFSEDSAPVASTPLTGQRPTTIPRSSSISRNLSPAPQRVRDPSNERSHSRTIYPARNTMSRQASTDADDVQQARTREYTAVVETLQGMFPSLDKDVIQDVVRSHEGNVSRAVDACLAISG